jgi:hypothetical protein
MVSGLRGEFSEDSFLVKQSLEDFEGPACSSLIVQSEKSL